MKVANILKQKGRDVMTVRPTERIDIFAHRLKLARIGAMVVSADGDEMQGIITERDIVYGIAEHGAKTLEMTVADLMTKRLATCRPDDSVAQVAKIMTESRVRHLPVLENGKLIGVVSIGDVVKNRLDEMSMEANILRDIAIRRG